MITINPLARLILHHNITEAQRSSPLQISELDLSAVPLGKLGERQAQKRCVLQVSTAAAAAVPRQQKVTVKILILAPSRSNTPTNGLFLRLQVSKWSNTQSMCVLLVGCYEGEHRSGWRNQKGCSVNLERERYFNDGAEVYCNPHAGEPWLPLLSADQALSSQGIFFFSCFFIITFFTFQIDSYLGRKRFHAQRSSGQIPWSQV